MWVVVVVKEKINYCTEEWDWIANVDMYQQANVICSTQDLLIARDVEGNMGSRGPSGSCMFSGVPEAASYLSMSHRGPDRGGQCRDNAR